MQTESITWKEMLVLGGLGIIAYFVIKPKDKSGEKAEDKGDVQALSKKTQYAFSESFYSDMLRQEGYTDVTSYLNKYSLSISEINDYCVRIYDSKSYFDDDEDMLYSVFRIMKTITVCSIVAKTFKVKYQKSLYGYLANFLNSTEMNRIYDILSKKNYL